MAVPGETSAGPSPSAAPDAGSGSAASGSSAILLPGRRGRKWGAPRAGGGLCARKSLGQRQAKGDPTLQGALGSPAAFYGRSRRRRALTIHTAAATLFPQSTRLGQGTGGSASPQTSERAGAPQASGRGLECFRFPSAPAPPRPRPSPPRPRPAAGGWGARVRGRGRVGKDRRRDPEARLARPPPPRPPAPTRSARLSHDQGDPHLQQPREAAALQVLPALRESPAAADAG